MSSSSNNNFHTSRTHITQRWAAGERESLRRQAFPSVAAMSAPEKPSPSPPVPPSLPSVVAIEAEPEALLIGWEEVPDAVCYELQMAKKAPESIGG